MQEPPPIQLPCRWIPSGWYPPEGGGLVALLLLPFLAGGFTYFNVQVDYTPTEAAVGAAVVFFLTPVVMEILRLVAWQPSVTFDGEDLALAMGRERVWLHKSEVRWVEAAGRGIRFDRWDGGLPVFVSGLSPGQAAEIRTVLELGERMPTPPSEPIAPRVLARESANPGLDSLAGQGLASSAPHARALAYERVRKLDWTGRSVAEIGLGVAGLATVVFSACAMVNEGICVGIALVVVAAILVAVHWNSDPRPTAVALYREHLLVEFDEVQEVFPWEEIHEVRREPDGIWLINAQGIGRLVLGVSQEFAESIERSVQDASSQPEDEGT